MAGSCNAEIIQAPRHGTPVSHPVGRPRGVTRMCRGGVVRICSQYSRHDAGVSQNGHPDLGHAPRQVNRGHWIVGRLKGEREYEGLQWRLGFEIPAALWGGDWLHTRTTTPRHIRVTPRGRRLGCDTGVPRCGRVFSYNAENKPPPRHGTPVSHPVGRQRGVTRMCRAVEVRICLSGGSWGDQRGWRAGAVRALVLVGMVR